MLAQRDAYIRQLELLVAQRDAGERPARGPEKYLFCTYKVILHFCS